MTQINKMDEFLKARGLGVVEELVIPPVEFEKVISEKMIIEELMDGMAVGDLFIDPLLEDPSPDPPMEDDPIIPPVEDLLLNSSEVPLPLSQEIIYIEPPDEIDPIEDSVTPKQNQAAMLDAMGRGAGEIAEEVGVAVGTVSKWRLQREYKDRRGMFIRGIEQRWIKKAGDDFCQKLDGFVDEAIDKQVELMRQGENLSVSLQASEKLLDRAPSAPRIMKGGLGEGEGGLIIQIGIQAVEGMQKALEDVGQGEVVDLIKGQGWREGDG